MKRAILSLFLLTGIVLTLGTVGCKAPAKGVTRIPPPRPPVVGGETGPRSPLPGGPGPGANPNVGRQPDVSPGPTIRSDEGATGKPIEPKPVATGGGEQPPPEIWENMIVDTNYFKAQTIYFEFDSSVVRSTEMGRLQAVGDEMKAKPENRLLIDGHCDERGTEEYNRALGERRALAAREALVKYGIAPERISTRSWGEDRPAEPGHDEAAWAKNRRDEFNLLLPQK